MKFGKHFKAAQLRGSDSSETYLDYKELKKLLKCKGTTGEQWREHFWSSIERIDASMLNAKLKLPAQMHAIIGGSPHKAGKLELKLKANGDFLAEVLAFWGDASLNLIACTKICKKHDTSRVRSQL